MDPRYLKIVSDLSRKLTRYEISVDVLKPDLIDDYPPLTRLVEASLTGANGRGTLMIPELRFDGNESIGIFSDYGGESHDSEYQTYSILVFGWNHAQPFMGAIEEVRTRYGFNSTTEMSYKDLRRGELNRCLPEYLKTCDAIAGMLFTLVIHKDVPSVLGGAGKDFEQNLVSRLAEHGFGNRKRRGAEKLLRIVHTAAYLTAWLSTEGQGLFWMTDNDEIVATEERALQTVKLFQSVLRCYSDHDFGTTGYACPTSMDATGRLTDFLSVADLSAGAVERYLTKRDNGTDGTLRHENEIILNWLGHHGLGLKKHTMLVRLEGDNQLTSSELRFGPEKIPKNVVTIPVPIKRL